MQHASLASSATDQGAVGSTQFVLLPIGGTGPGPDEANEQLHIRTGLH